MFRSGPLRSYLAATAIVVGVLLALWGRAPLQRLDVFDQPFYLGIADDLLHEGRFTNGYMFAPRAADGAARPSGMRFGPLYPALLAGLATVDPVLRRDMDCEVAGSGRDRACRNGAPSIRWLQVGMLALAYVLVWSTARLLLPPRGAGLALGLALLTAPLTLATANYLMTETTCLLLTTGLTRCLAGLVRAPNAKRALVLAGGGGVLLGLATLTRPGFLYLVPPVVLGLALARAAGCRHGPGAGVALLLAAGATLAPWIARNEVMFGRAAVSFGYAAHTLAQRISFDRMTGREYALSFLCWLPDGNGLGHALIGPHSCDRFGWNERRDTFYAIGMDRLVPETRRAAGSAANWLPWLLRHEVLAHPFRHLATTLPLALRGLWVDHDWGLVLGPLTIALTVRAWRRRDLTFLALALPAWFMLVFNASVAVNQVRYNLMLIPPFAIAGATACSLGAARYRPRRSAPKGLPRRRAPPGV